MYSSNPELAAKVEIPSVYVTMADGAVLLDAGNIDLEVSSLVIFVCLRLKTPVNRVTDSVKPFEDPVYKRRDENTDLQEAVLCCRAPERHH